MCRRRDYADLDAPIVCAFLDFRTNMTTYASLYAHPMAKRIMAFSRSLSSESMASYVLWSDAKTSLPLRPKHSVELPHEKPAAALGSVTAPVHVASMKSNYTKFLIAHFKKVT